jgi:hypothetical protein
MTKHLENAKRAPPGSRIRRRPNGWTPERRARQAAIIRLHHPWRHATGPRTEAGKAGVAMNALRHGCRSRAWILKARRIRRAIRLCACTVTLVRALKQRESFVSRIASSRTQLSLFPPTFLGDVAEGRRGDIPVQASNTGIP